MTTVAAMSDQLKSNISGGKKSLVRPTYNTRHVSTEWPISDVSSDLVVEVGSSTFALHKFPLVSRSGRIRHELKDTKTSRINLTSIPGGPESFELAAKFCYGIHIEITLTNIASLRCASHYLEMTDDYAPPREKNLESRTESYLKETVFPNITNSITVLRECHNLLPFAEDVKLVPRIITAVANNACKEQLSSGLLKLERNYHPSSIKGSFDEPEGADWWGKSLGLLNIDLFQRVVSALKLKGLKHEVISRILIHYYAYNSLQGGQVMIRDHQHPQQQLVMKGCSSGNGYNMDMELIKKQRMIVEVIVSLLPIPSRKNCCVPIAFLSSLLKSGIVSGVSSSCKNDLERRIGFQLDQAILEDVIIPAAAVTASSMNVIRSSNSCSSSTLYDIDTVLRIFSIFLNLEEEEEEDNRDDDDDHLGGDEMMYDFDHGPTIGSPKQSSMLKVSKLLDNYLAEVALDSSLSPSKFIALAELLPDHARIITDSLYRAVDIYLKVHPNIKDSERYRLCKTIDCQKLSQEASSHAAQNERLPVQIAVQVLYYEQIRLRNAMLNSTSTTTSLPHPHHSYLFGNTSLNNGSQLLHPQSSCAGSGAITPRDNYASVRRENRELKLEVTRMRMRLTDLEKDHVHMKKEMVTSGTNMGNKLFRSFSKKLSRLGLVFRSTGNGGHGGIKASSLSSSKVDHQSHQSRFFFRKRRHHSIS